MSQIVKTSVPFLEVTVTDPVTGDSRVEEISSYGFVLVLGESMEVSSMSRYANGTVQFTIKPVRE